MTDQQKPDPKVVEADSFVKAVFDHLRNLLICSSLAVAAVAIAHFSALMPVNEILARAFAVILMSCSIWLIFLNIYPIALRLDSEWTKLPFYRKITIIAGVVVYLNIAFAILAATLGIFFELGDARAACDC